LQLSRRQPRRRFAGDNLSVSLSIINEKRPSAFTCAMERLTAQTTVSIRSGRLAAFVRETIVKCKERSFDRSRRALEFRNRIALRKDRIPATRE
jgi:hypothetical protein